MNHIHRIIYNHTFGAWVAVAENIKNHSKVGKTICSANFTKYGFALFFKTFTFVTLMALDGRAWAAKYTCVENGTVVVPVATNADGTVVCGDGAVAEAVNAITIGTGAKVKNNASSSAIALGHNTEVYAKQSVAIGSNIVIGADGSGGVAIGSDDSGGDSSGVYNKVDGVVGGFQNSTKSYRKTYVNGKGTTAIAAHAQALSQGSTAIGVGATAGDGGISKIGSWTETSVNIEATAIGALSRASKEKSTAIGALARATAKNSTALGHNAWATGEDAYALGSGARARGENSIALGTGSSAGAATGSANSKLDTVAIGNNAKAYASQAISIGSDIKTSGNYGIAISSNASARAINSTGYAGVAIGSGGANMGAIAKGESAVAIGGGNSNSNLLSGAVAEGKNSVALGSGSSSKLDNTVALGSQSIADRIAIKAASVVAVLGTADPTMNQVYSPVVDNAAVKNTIKGNLGAVSVGSKTATRQVINVAAGSKNTDAVNVAQLKAVEILANSGWNIASNGGVKDMVAAGNTVNFINGNATTATVSYANGLATVKYDLNYDTNIFKIKNNQLTLKNSKLSVNNSNNLASGTNNSQTGAGTGIGGGNLTVEAGKNLKAQLANSAGTNTVTISTANEVNFDKIQVGNVIINNNKGINAGSKQIKNIASGLGGRTVEEIKQQGSSAPEWNNAATVGDLTTVKTSVTNVDTIIGGTDANNPNVVQALTTYDVSGQTATKNSNILSAIKNLNTGGIKYFHTNDSSGQTTDGAVSNTDDSSASGKYATAVGYRASATAENALAIGKEARALGTNSIAIGTGNVVSGNRSGAIGDPTFINADDSYAIGNNNKIAASSNKVFVLGNDVNVSAGNTGAVVLGDKSTVEAAHVGDYTLGGIRDAQVAGSKGAGTQVVSVGALGNERQIQNVAPGVVSPTSTDAINGSQLYQVSQQLGGVQQDLAKVRADANAGAASAIAIASMGQSYKPGGKTVGMGVGMYRGENAIAIGASVISDNGKWILKGAINTNSRGHTGAGASVNYHW